MLWDQDLSLYIHIIKHPYGRHQRRFEFSTLRLSFEPLRLFHTYLGADRLEHQKRNDWSVGLS